MTAAATTVSVRLSATLTMMTKRDCRSVGVAMRVALEPSTSAFPADSTMLDFRRPLADRHGIHDLATTLTASGGMTRTSYTAL